MMKTMKYYLKNIFLAASCLWLFTACNDFLTLYPEDDIVDDKIYNFIIHWFTATYSVF